jgi:hypothetical protein
MMEPVGWPMKTLITNSQSSCFAELETVIPEAALL